MLFNTLKYNFDWESVTCGFWRKSPSKYLPYINNVYPIGATVLPDEKRLVVQRMYHVRFNFPFIIRKSPPQRSEKIVGTNPEYYFLEESTVDLNKRRLSYHVRGLTPEYYRLVRAAIDLRYTENASYEPSAHPGVTEFSSNIDVKIHGFGVLNRSLEKFCRKHICESITMSNEFKAMLESISAEST